MQRFNVENNNNKIYFTETDILHITKVLRKKVNDYLECIDQDNNLIKAKIKSINPFIALIESIVAYSVEKPYPIDLFISVIKKKEFELVVEKLSELNVNSITPVYFNRTQRNFNLDNNRLKRIAIESCKQCKRSQPIIINNPIEYQALIDLINKNKNFIFANEKEVSYSLDNSKIDFNNNIGLIIGPEGGFTDQEIKTLNSLCYSVTLTNTILRAETAAIYLSSCVIEGIKKHEK